MTTRALTAALIAAMASRATLAADIAPPPAPMEGGEAVEFVESLADQPGGGDSERVTVGKDQSGLVVRGRDDAETTTKIIELKSPTIAAKKYIVKGWIKYEGVEGDGYMEMLSRFDGHDFFSRTLGDRGPMGKLKGDSQWRIFLLQFTLEPGMRPEHIAVNVILPGKGAVTITGVRLVQFNDPPATPPATAPAANGSLPPAIPPSPPLTHSTSTVLIWSAVTAFVACLVVASAMLRRRRRRHETITSELRRMHALDAI
jgi:hypothetical protein